MSYENLYDIDYSQVSTTARVALYDDFASTPRITKIEPADTAVYIENLTVTIYEQSKLAGGKIPYSVIREVSENFIHAHFCEVVVSILDNGNTIRFTDQGPGIQEKEKAQQPGFSSAIEPMKDYIRGVGSGFPLVKDYLNGKDGSIVIEDNLVTGAVVTISLVPRKNEEKLQQEESTTPVNAVKNSFIPHVPLSGREQEFLKLFLQEGDLGVTELHDLTGITASTVHNTLKKLQESALIEYSVGKKRGLTELGYMVAKNLS